MVLLTKFNKNNNNRTLVYTSQYIDFHDFKKLKSYGWQLSYFFKNNSNETMSNEGK